MSELTELRAATELGELTTDSMSTEATPAQPAPCDTDPTASPSLPRHRQLRALVRWQDMPVRRVRALSTPAGKAAAPSLARAPVPAKPTAPVRLPHVAHSGHVGRFYRSKPLQSLPAQVTKGQALGVVKAMGLEFSVLAPCSGWVDAVDVLCGCPVEYGQALVVLRTTA